jgi:hypothetical protein
MRTGALIKYQVPKEQQHTAKVQLLHMPRRGEAVVELRYGSAAACYGDVYALDNDNVD